MTVFPWVATGSPTASSARRLRTSAGRNRRTRASSVSSCRALGIPALCGAVAPDGRPDLTATRKPAAAFGLPRLSVWKRITNRMGAFTVTQKIALKQRRSRERVGRSLAVGRRCDEARVRDGEDGGERPPGKVIQSDDDHGDQVRRRAGQATSTAAISSETYSLASEILSDGDEGKSVRGGAGCHGYIPYGKARYSHRP